LPVPHLVAAISIGLLLGQSGLLARLVNATGVITMPAEMPALVYDPLAVGIIVTYVWKEVPFVTLVMLAALGSRLIELEQAARTLGATPLQTLLHITLPLIAPSLLGAATIVFVFTFGSFEVPVLLGQRYPRMLAVEAFVHYSDTDLQLRPLALALNTLIVVVTVLASIPCLWLLRRANPAAPARDRAASTEHVAR
jgi:putative spermidine/putrescine transport system permease protein